MRGLEHIVFSGCITDRIEYQFEDASVSGVGDLKLYSFCSVLVFFLSSKSATSAPPSSAHFSQSSTECCFDRKTIPDTRVAGQSSRMAKGLGQYCAAASVGE